MSDPHPQPHESDEHTDDPPDSTSPSVTTIFAGALRRIRTNPRVILALLIAGVVISGVDWLRLHDPIPSIGYRGIQEGHLSVLLGIVITVFSRVTVPLSALVGLKPQWFAWAIGLKLLGFAVVTGAGAYALSRLLQTPLTTAATLRYAGVVVFLHLGPENIQFEGGGLLLAIPLLVLFFFLALRLFALPGLLVTGYSLTSALQQSWRRTKGHSRSLFAVIILLGILNHLLLSVPVVGPLGSAVVAVLHVGTVAAFSITLDP
jgi:hypothetical protein